MSPSTRHPVMIVAIRYAASKLSPEDRQATTEVLATHRRTMLSYDEFADRRDHEEGYTSGRMTASAKAARARARHAADMVALAWSPGYLPTAADCECLGERMAGRLSFPMQMLYASLPLEQRARLRDAFVQARNHRSLSEEAGWILEDFEAEEPRIGSLDVC